MFTQFLPPLNKLLRDAGTNIRLRRGLGACLALAAVAATRTTAGAAPVAPTNNTSGPKLGFYEWNVVDDNHPAQSRFKWMATSMNRDTLWVEDFIGTSSWSDIQGSDYQFTFASNFLRENAGAMYVLAVGLLPGYQNQAAGGTSLATGATGAYNTYFQTLAQRLVARGLADRTVIRLGHEFNGNWYAWEVKSHTDALNYAAYFQQVAGAMRAVTGASGLKFCWNGIAFQNDNTATYPLSDAFPTNGCVDYVGADLYDSSYYYYPIPAGATDAATRQQNAWNQNTVSGNQSLSYFKAIATNHSLPLAIPEWGLGDSGHHGGGDNTYYIQQMYNLIQDPANNVAWHIYFDVWASDGNHEISESPSQSATAFPTAAAAFKQAFAVPPLVVNNDIGTTGAVGGCTPFAATGAGTGFLTGTSDNFHLVSKSVTGDTLCQTQITSVSNPTSGQSGLMIRQSAGATDTYAALFLKNGNLVFQSRTSPGSAAVQNFVTASVTSPVWLKLLRTGNVISGYTSADGLNWAYAGGQTVSMTGSVLAGVAVSNGASGTLNTVGIASVNNTDIRADYYDTSTSKETSITPAISSAIFLDSAATTGVTKTGNWTASGAQVRLYNGGTMLTAYTPGTASTVKFTPTIPTAGQYDVYITAPGNYQDGDKSPVSVTSTTGTWTGTYNEQNNDGLWIRLGTFNFAAGTTGSLTIGNSGDVGGKGYVSVDATMFVSVPPVTAQTATPPAGVMSLTKGATASTTMVVSWGAISGATGYTIGYQSSGTTWQSVSTSATSVTLTGLTPNTWYWVQGVPYNSAGNGTWTGVYSFQTAP